MFSWTRVLSGNFEGSSPLTFTVRGDEPTNASLPANTSLDSLIFLSVKETNF